ncbi:MAG: Uma2 family endonuclease [Oscillospiraceae bacterium]|nr:Uma2 family endonuclease [Oscillospiraceae bacterium]
MSVNLAEEPGYTYKDYITWTGKIRYEIIDGTAYAMAAPSQAHQEILGELHFRLKLFLQGKPCKVFVAPFSVRLNSGSFDDTVVEPDVFVVCDKSKLNGKSVKGAPDMVIEILSPYNTRHDTVIKFRQYQKAGVKEYWTVDPVTKSVVVHVLENGKYISKTYNEDDIISVYTLEGCQINLSEIFYDTLEFDPEEPDESEFITKQKMIEALKYAGVGDEQIKKAVEFAGSRNG